MNPDSSNLLQENVSLAGFTNFRIGGPARWFAEPITDEAAVTLIRLAGERSWPIALLGNGANTLVSDQGFPGLVIHMRNDDLRVDGQCIVAGAGVTLRSFLSSAARAGLGDPKFLSVLAGVPGSIGGSIYGNAGQGAGKQERHSLGDVVDEVTIVSRTGDVSTLRRDDCEFEYRNSRFKRTKEIVLRAKFFLPKGDTPTLLASIKNAALAKNGIQPTSGASAGCIFTNVRVDDAEKLPSELRPHVEHGYLSAWRAVAAAGCQGKVMGGAQVSPLHANYIVNVNQATAEHVIMLISYVKQQVRDTLGLQLHEEVQYLGF